MDAVIRCLLAADASWLDLVYMASGTGKLWTGSTLSDLPVSMELRQGHCIRVTQTSFSRFLEAFSYFMPVLPFADD